MSRYETQRNGQTIAYGFDKPLSQYFLQVFDHAGELVSEENNRGKIFEELSKCDGVPVEHIEMLAMDMPF